MKQLWRRLCVPHAPPYMLRAFAAEVEHGRWDDGPRVRTLERRIARRLDVPPEWVLCTSSCAAALQAAGWCLTGRDETIRVCPLTFAATYNWAWGRVEWVDCDEEGWPVDQVDVAVELWGRQTGSACTILDAAHRLLDPWHAEFLEQGGGAVCYSFNCQKEAPCLHGGAVVSPHVNDDWRAFIHNGTRGRQPFMRGIKGYLNDPLAPWIWESIRKLKTTKTRRQRVLEGYEEFLGRWLMTKPGEASGHLAVIRAEDEGHAKLIKAALDRHRVEWSIHFPILEGVEEECPTAASLSRRIISLPCHASMKKGDAVRIARIVAGA